MTDRPPLDFGEHPDVVFKKSPLTKVLCQVRFNAVTSLLTKVGVVGFQEALRSEYPNFEQENSAQVALSPRETAVKREVPIWRMSDQSKEWRTSIAVDFVALESDSYVDFPDFRARLVPVLDALYRTVHPSQTTRIGLRYINNLSHNLLKEGENWSSILDSSLLGFIANTDLPGQIRGSMAELQFLDDLGDSMIVRHGIPTQGEKPYIMDMDYFTTRPFDVDPESSIPDILLGFSRSMTSFFHRALTPEGNARLEPAPRKSTK